MENLDVTQRMQQLIEYLNYHQGLYDADKPQISDKEWDEAYFELKELEIHHGYSLPNSPTQKVNYTVVNELKKVKHEYQPMLSLDKTKDIEEIKEFIGNKEWIAMLKLDGLTCRLTYEEGKLVRAETRGDGIEGEDITHNARVLPSIPQRIDYYNTLIVDGEVICKRTDFSQFQEKYANARNFSAGSIRLLDSNECAKRGLTFVAWDIITENGDDEWGTLSAKLMYLHSYGFSVVPYNTQQDYSLDTVIDMLVEDNAHYNDFCYPIDGIVFKWDNCAEYQAAGRTDHHFKGGMAYKFYDEQYDTILRNIDWTMGRTGVLTPTAVYDEIEMEGTMCTRASLHNINTLVETLGEYPFVGQKIKTFKANMINPQIGWAERAEEVLGADPAYFLDDPDIQFLFPPKVCPICGGNTEIRESDSGTIELYCANDQCEGKLINRCEHFAGKKGLDIKGVSKATFEKLIEWGWISKVMDILKLREYRAEWIKKPGFGVKSVDKILDAIDAASCTTLEKYISALGIPLIGKTYAKELAGVFGDYVSFREAVINHFDFTVIDGFGPAMHDAIIQFNYYEADRMFDMGFIKIEEGREMVKNGNAPLLENTIICVTGKLHNFKNRDELKSLIESHGGKMTTSVSSKTTYLVNNDINSSSSKNITAKSLGIPIITEEELLEKIK